MFDKAMTEPLDALIRRVADRHGLPPNLVCALVQVESAGDPWAFRYEPLFLRDYLRSLKFSPRPPCSFDTEQHGRATSWGLLQVMGQVARERGFSGVFLAELCDPELGLEYGCRQLALLARRYYDRRSWDRTIAAYNAGSPRQNTEGRFVNQTYVDKVNRQWAAIG